VFIRATDTELELSGSIAELRRVATALTGLAAGEGRRFAADPTDPAPYLSVLASLEATASEGPVRVRIAGDALLVSGSPDELRRFASFLEFCDGDPPGTHHHHEWWEGNDFIAVDSRPLVIAVI
jgi:hypothetical protein